MSHRIFRSAHHVFLEHTGAPGLFRHADETFSFDDLFRSPDPAAYVAGHYDDAEEGESFDPTIPFEAPLENQEVWAAGVTYYRSRTARMEEAESAGGDIFYDRVYDADRPELFLKATAARTRGHGDRVGIRADSTWDVPEPELTLALSSEGTTFGHTVGNDMSSRSIEGENPLYLPQAKVYTGSCAIGPCLVVGDSPDEDTTIAVEIRRDGEVAFGGEIAVSQIKRSFEELAEHLFHSNQFPCGAYLMTGTGIVPNPDFTLQPGDEIVITIEGVGTLANEVERV